jgi:hypothetical protein
MRVRREEKEWQDELVGRGSIKSWPPALYLSFALERKQELGLTRGLNRSFRALQQAGTENIRNSTSG